MVRRLYGVDDDVALPVIHILRLQEVFLKAAM
jgi:hypothetical protein